MASMMGLERVRAIVDELQCLVGGRIQRVDVVELREIVVEIRVPGRTLRLLVSARAQLGRIHLVERRPPRAVPGGSLQSTLRKRLVGRPLIRIGLESRTVGLFVPETAVEIRLDGTKDAFSIHDSLLEAGGADPIPIPERFLENEAAAADYEIETDDVATERLRRHLLRPIAAAEKKEKRLFSKLEKDRERLEKMSGELLLGELLKTVLHDAKRGQDGVDAIDYATGTQIRIPLDPRLGPKANLSRLFSRAKKGARGLPLVTKRQKACAQRIETLGQRRSEVERADAGALGALSSGLDDALRPSRSVPKGAKAVSPIDRWSRRFSSADGTEIRVGKGAEGNDRLTFRAARGHDLWLHARGVPGAHVLLRLNRRTSRQVLDPGRGARGREL